MVYSTQEHVRVAVLVKESFIFQGTELLLVLEENIAEGNRQRTSHRLDESSLLQNHILN